jgi:hypothetical protein
MPKTGVTGSDLGVRPPRRLDGGRLVGSLCGGQPFWPALMPLADSHRLAADSAVLAWAIQRTGWPVQEPPAPDLDDLEGSLTAIANGALRRALDPSIIKLGQIAIAQASRFPEIARRAYAAGFWPRQQLVVDLLNQRAASGALVADDPEILAEHFLGMVAGVPSRLASFGIVRDAADQEQHRA